MRARDVVVGRTYVVLIPHRISQDRYPDCNQPGTPAWTWWWRQGTRFRLTVTEVDTTSTPVIVEGIRFTEHSAVEVELTDEQAATLGLPLGHYLVRGQLFDEADHLVALPEVEPIRVLLRWLREPDAVGDSSHRDLDQHRGA